jgi:SAM-dependent methyltransferase
VTESQIREAVREGYATIAETGVLSSLTAPDGGGCCGSAKAPLSSRFLAEKLGYSEDQLAALPEGSNMGLSCGNPTAIANLQPGQVVLDLGSGGGFDCFLAGPKVGETGRVIGVDMTSEMLAKARSNIDHYRKATGLSNVEFRLGEIEYLPVADCSVDVVISNCVINLSTDKPQVWREIARTLRPGGYVAASDMTLLRPLPDEIRQMPEAQVACVGGAILIDDYRRMVEEAGLGEIVIEPKANYVEALLDAGDPLYLKIRDMLGGTHPEEYITSVDVMAMKPGQ